MLLLIERGSSRAACINPHSGWTYLRYRSEFTEIWASIIGEQRKIFNINYLYLVKETAVCSAARSLLI